MRPLRTILGRSRGTEQKQKHNSQDSANDESERVKRRKSTTRHGSPSGNTSPATTTREDPLSGGKEKEKWQSVSKSSALCEKRIFEDDIRVERIIGDGHCEDAELSELTNTDSVSGSNTSVSKNTVPSLCDSISPFIWKESHELIKQQLRKMVNTRIFMERKFLDMKEGNEITNGYIREAIKDRRLVMVKDVELDEYVERTGRILVTCMNRKRSHVQQKMKDQYISKLSLMCEQSRCKCYTN